MLQSRLDRAVLAEVKIEHYIRTGSVVSTRVVGISSMGVCTMKTSITPLRRAHEYELCPVNVYARNAISMHNLPLSRRLRHASGSFGDLNNPSMGLLLPSKDTSGLTLPFGTLEVRAVSLPFNHNVAVRGRSVPCSERSGLPPTPQTPIRNSATTSLIST